MPQAIPAAVAFVSAVWSSAVTATAVALTNVGVMAAIGEGATIALASKLVTAASFAALSATSVALMRPSAPSSGTALEFKPDPKAPVRGLMGYHATGGNKVFQETWGYNGVALTLGVALSLGPIESIDTFYADGSPVAFAGPQQEAVGFYARDMWQRTSLGAPVKQYLAPPTGFKYETPRIQGWAEFYSTAPQVAFSLWTMVQAKNPEDRNVYTSGVPDPRWVGRWMKVYDWRKDSTYPGGSGPQREDNWSTWQFSENPYVHARAWLRGHYKMNDNGTIDRQKLIAGVGVTPDAIDMAAFTEAANVADANNWKISGEWSTSDDKAQVLFAMMQAGSGRVIPRGAQISVMVNAPRVSTYTVTRDDVLGQASIKPLTRRRERKNTIIPRYRSEAHNWEYVAAKDVTATVYRNEDRGEPRSLEIQYTYVRDAKQAAQLAAYDLVNLREGLSITIPGKVHLMHIHPGDCITVNVPEMALSNQKVIVLRAAFDSGSGVTTIECRSETDGKHTFALGQVAEPPPSPALSAVDPNYIPPPLPEDWAVLPKPPYGDGTSQPIIIVNGSVDRGDIASTIVEYGTSETGPWQGAGSIDPSTGSYQITGLNSLGTYWVSIRYVANNGTVSDRYISGPYQVAPLSAGVSSETIDEIIKDVVEAVEDGREDVKEYEDLAESLIESILNGYNADWREQVQKNEAVAIAYESSQTYTDQFEARATQTFATIAALDDGLAYTLNQSESYTNGSISSALNLVYTKAETDAGLASTLSASKSYVDDFKAEASLTYATKTEFGDGLAETLSQSKSYTDDFKAEASIIYATKAEFGEGLAETLSLSKSYTDDLKAEASLTYATKTEFGDGLAQTLSQSKSYTDDAGNVLASQINNVSARSGGQTNIVKNPAAVQGTQFWSGGSVGSAQNDTVGTFFFSSGTVVSQTYSCSAGQVISLSLNSENQGGGAYINYLPSNTIAQYVGFSGASWTERKRSTSSVAAPAGTTGFQVVIQGTGTVYWTRVMANLGPVPNDYRDDAAIPALSASVTEASEAAISADGIARAIYGITTDVNGYVSGFSSINNGATSEFNILADKFGVRAPGTGARTEYENGIWYSYNAANTVRSSWGKPHGSTGDIVWWTGLNSVAKGSETRSSAYVYVATSAPRFGGSDTPTPGGGSSGYASGVKQASTSFYAGTAWETVESFTVAGVPASPGITANIEWQGPPSVSDSGTWNGQIRIIETTTNVVVGAAQPISITHNSEPPANVSLVGEGTLTGGVQYSIQVSRSTGSNNVTAISFQTSFDAYQRL